MGALIAILLTSIPIAYLFGYARGSRDEKEIAMKYLETQGRSDPSAVQYRTTKKHKKKDKVRVYREKPKKVTTRIWPAKPRRRDTPAV